MPTRRPDPLFVRLCSGLGLPASKVLYLVSDVACLMGSVLLAMGLRALIGNYHAPLGALLPLFVLLLCSPLMALMLGLYTSTLLRPPHEVLYRIFCFVSATYGILFMVFFVAQSGALHSRFIYLAGWMLACLVVPLGRHYVHRRFCAYHWWGLPLVFFSRSPGGRALWHHLRRHPEYGFRPVAFLDLPEEGSAALEKKLRDITTRFPGAVALLASEQENRDRGFFTLVNTFFPRIIIFPLSPSKEAVHSFLVTPFVLGTDTGFLLQQRLHDRRRLAIKRAMDLVLVVLGSVVVVPLCLVLALLVRLDSPGPAFYTQRRIGMGGREIRVHKFRTMVRNADEVLAGYLAANPHLAEEWERDHKLRDDPRITRVGHFLRRTSLDELPQLWDVFLGTMSLVGPRPIVAAERGKYGQVFDAYIRVRPGVTGLWQISGRSDTTYDKRVDYDFFYVSNWSVWLDIWILARTVPEVVLGRGAY